jgi:hypothetical protein
MTNAKENVKQPRLPVLSTNKWLLITLIFFFGIICLLVSRQLREYELFSLILDLLGGFLVVAIPIEILREVFFEEANTASFVAQVSQIFDDKIDAELVQARKIGLDSIESSLSFKKIFDDLQPGDTLWWLDTFAPAHRSWIEHVTRAIQRGVSVNMLILDPKSPLCAMRAMELAPDFTLETFLAELSLFIADFNNLSKQKNLIGHLNICLYDDLLGAPIYLVTKNAKPIYAYSSMYLSKPTGVDFPHFRWNEGPMCEILFHYVREKYNLAIEKQNP